MRAADPARDGPDAAGVWAAVGTGLAAMILVLCHLFVPAPIGTADTGDGLRLLCQLQAGDPHFAQAHSSTDRFVAIRYQHIPPNPVACGSFRQTERYPSSALVVLAAAQQLTQLLQLPGTLDMRLTGMIYSLLFGVVIGLFVLVLPGPRWARVTAAGVLGLLGADATFVPYFISPFSEPMEFVALLASYAGLLALWRRRVVPWWLLAAVTFAFGMLVTAKSQDISLAVLLAPALLVVRCPLGSWTGRVRARVLPALAASLLLGLAGLNFWLQPRLYNEQVVFSSVFYTILRDSPDVPADLADLHLPARLSRYAGQTYFQARTRTATDPAYAVFVRDISFSDVAAFYLRHPQRLGPLLREGVRDVVTARYRLPNTTRGQSATPQVVCRICLVADAGQTLRPVALVVWPGWELAVLLIGALLARRRRHDPPWRALGWVLVTGVGFAVFHLATASVGAGSTELGKHVFPAVVDTWLMPPLVAVALVGLLRSRRGPAATLSPPDSPQPEPASEPGSVRPAPVRP